MTTKEELLNTKSNYYLEDCIENDCNKELARTILEAREKKRVVCTMNFELLELTS